MAREYRKCPSCGEYRHDMQYPWLNPDATVYPAKDPYARAEPASTYEQRYARSVVEWQKRADALAVRRKAAQAEGRDYSACIPCQNGDA